ncbi:hypothetical protein BC832DRAFT_527575 [Gaertneriomyces semiglobifer]|nr:hypothetical protein BC832DRAFT_527575 [Gaertneriomyces semiglobifer]
MGANLRKQLGPEYISSRPGPGGGKVYYLEGWKSTQLANEIFGFNGWSHSIVDITLDYVDKNEGKISLGISAVVRVTLKDGTYHEDIGYAFAENQRNQGQAFEKAKKEAVTDATKRALRAFGNSLGNCLYDKDYVKKIGRMSAVPVRHRRCLSHQLLFPSRDSIILWL